MWHYAPDLENLVEEIDRHTLFDQNYIRVRHPQTGQTYQLPIDRLQPVDELEPLSGDAVMVRAIAGRITEALKSDVMLSPLDADIIPLPHQLYALNRAMERNPVRFLLADEVGLGKTIEAGLILRELKLRGEVERILVLVPKSLLIQWVSEMETHFGETFTLGQTSEIKDEAFWKMQSQVVVSIDSVKPMEKRRNWTQRQIDAHNRERFDAVIDTGWDLVIIDEAHKVAGAAENVARHQLARHLADTVPHLLLLSATPHSGKTEAFHRLMSLLDLDAFPSLDTVNRQSVQAYVIRTEKRRAVDASGNPLFRPRQTRLIPVEWGSTGGQALESAQKQLYECVTEYVVKGYNRAQQEQQAAVGFLMVLMQRLVTSSTRAIRSTLERRIAVLDEEHQQLENRSVETSGPAIGRSAQEDQIDEAELLELDAESGERITLEHPHVRSLLTASARVVEGMTIPRFHAPGLPPTLEGIWSLWELRLWPAFEPNRLTALTDPMRRVFPVFINTQGRPLWSSARSVWEWFLRENSGLHSDGKASDIPFDKIAAIAEAQAEPLFEEMKAAYRTQVGIERDRANFSFEAKRKLLARIGLESVRKYREAELRKTHETRLEALERRQHIAPALMPIVIIQISGAAA